MNSVWSSSPSERSDNNRHKLLQRVLQRLHILLESGMLPRSFLGDYNSKQKNLHTEVVAHPYIPFGDVSDNAKTSFDGL
jgi:hypothetical protein